jgi:hypothetical protein
MPHLSELQSRFADDGVTIIGVSKEDSSNSLADVKEMTADKGDTMAFTVAWDDAGQTYKDYMTAAGQSGIPTSFLVDREGRIAYIGHPMAMDIPMSMVVAGTWDPVKGPEEMKAMQAMQWEIMGGAQRADKEAAEALLEKVAEFKERWPDQAGPLAGAEYQLLINAERPTEALPIGLGLVTRAIAQGDSNALNGFAWGIVDPAAAPASRNLGLALVAATAASNLTDNADPAILDTLARCHFWLGGLDRAIELQEKAVEIATKEGSSMAEGLMTALDEYLAMQD